MATRRTTRIRKVKVWDDEVSEDEMVDVVETKDKSHAKKVGMTEAQLEEQIASEEKEKTDLVTNSFLQVLDELGYRLPERATSESFLKPELKLKRKLEEDEGEDEEDEDEEVTSILEEQHESVYISCYFSSKIDPKLAKMPVIDKEIMAKNIASWKRDRIKNKSKLKKKRRKEYSLMQKLEQPKTGLKYLQPRVKCCGKTFEIALDLEEHDEKYHTDGIFWCDHEDCQPKKIFFKQRKKLTRHKILDHLRSKPFKCQICSYSSAHKSNLFRHCKQRHVSNVSDGQKIMPNEINIALKMDPKNFSQPEYTDRLDQ